MKNYKSWLQLCFIPKNCSSQEVAEYFIHVFRVFLLSERFFDSFDQVKLIVFIQNSIYSRPLKIQIQPEKKEICRRYSRIFMSNS